MIKPGCQFASDNTSGICPEGWAEMERANAGYSPGYGNDAWTARAADLVRELFGTDCEIFLTFNGTAANSLTLAAMCQSYHSVICTDVAHIETDECGGPEFFSNGSKLLVAPNVNGKLLPAAIDEITNRRTDIHYPKPRVVSITQSTECGTVYTVDEIAAITDAARRLKLHVHMDGARFFNAVAALKVSPAEITWKLGVDALCLGGTKIGLGIGDIVVFFNHQLADEFEFRCKQAGQLASKMRYMSAPWVGLLETGAWKKHGEHANACAEKLCAKLEKIPGVKVLFPRQANAIFVSMPQPWLAALKQKGWAFYTFIGQGGARFMCSWQTTDAEINALAADVAAVASSTVPA
jgi:threonine aldolase